MATRPSGNCNNELRDDVSYGGVGDLSAEKEV
jgi:hypothetical protein